LLEEFMSQKLKVIDPGVVEVAASVRDLVERLQSDQTLLRVEDVARLLGVDQRTLQRRFREYVGVSPNGVVQRYRLHEAAERLKAGASSLASVAAELGYADQAHFARDFNKWIGRTPTAFVARESGVR
jgi:AraC-like DNA-binding protein